MTPTLVKRLEGLLKRLLAVGVALLWYRPGRAAAARRALAAPGPRCVLLVRVDDRVGEALLTTPLVSALHARGHTVEVLVHPRVRRVLEGHPHLARLWDTDQPFLRLRQLRARRYDVVVNCGNWDTPAVTSAIVSRLVARRAVLVGPACPPTGWVMDVAVAPLPAVRAEVGQRLHLLSPLLGPATLATTLSFRPVAPWRGVGPHAVINPGGRLGSRRLAPSVFAAAARAVLAAGLTPVVTWGPGEEALADAVVAAAPGSLRAPPTDLAGLAAVLAGARLAVTNNTGPMHLAVAVGCPTLALFLHMEVARWGHGPPHRMLDLTGLVAAGGTPEAAVAAAAEAFARTSASPG